MCELVSHRRGYTFFDAIDPHINFKGLLALNFAIAIAVKKAKKGLEVFIVDHLKQSLAKKIIHAHGIVVPFPEISLVQIAFLPVIIIFVPVFEPFFDIVLHHFDFAFVLVIELFQFRGCECSDQFRLLNLAVTVRVKGGENRVHVI